MFRLSLYFLLFVLMSPGLALAQSALLTSDVAVDLAGADAETARTKAMEEAQIQGFANLLDRLAPDQKKDILLEATVKQIVALVRGVQVLEEKFNGSHYRATLRVSYDALSVNTLISQRAPVNGVPAVAKRSSSILVIPVYSEGAGALLWEKDNPWLSTWQRLSLQAGNGMIVTPYGDAEDSARLNASAAETNAYEAFGPLLGRYGAAELSVLKVTYIAEPQPMITVTQRSIGANHSDTQTMEYRADLQENRDALLERAARELTLQLTRQHEGLLERRAAEGSNGGRQLIIIPIGTLSSWTKVKQKLQAMPVVNKVELRAITNDQVDAFISYKGTPEALESSLNASKFSVQKANHYWVISQ